MLWFRPLHTFTVIYNEFQNAILKLEHLFLRFAARFEMKDTKINRFVAAENGSRSRHSCQLVVWSCSWESVYPMDPMVENDPEGNTETFFGKPWTEGTHDPWEAVDPRW